MNQRLRFEILRRDNYRCKYCGATADEAKLTVDHVIPAALGGADEPSNLVTACQPCNAGKTSSTPDAATVADVEQRTHAFAEAMRQAAAIQQRDQQAQDAYRKQFEDYWEYLFWDGTLYRNSLSIVEGWYAAGLEISVLKSLMYSTHRRDSDEPFKYLCGCVRNVLRQRNEIAAQILAGDNHGDTEAA